MAIVFMPLGFGCVVIEGPGDFRMRYGDAEVGVLG